MTQRPRPLAGAWLAAAAGVGLLAACSGAGTAGIDRADGGGGSGPTTTSSSYYSPLQEYLSPSSAQALTDKDYAAKDKQVQELIAPCMQQEGFEYTPFVYPNSGVTIGPDKELQGRDYVAKFGYGISTYDQSRATSSSSEVVDPNQVIVQAMSPGEQEAYYAALYGKGMAVDFPSAPAPVEETSAAPSAATTDAGSAAGAATAGTGTAVSETSAPDTGAADPSSSGGAKPTDGMPALADQGCFGKAQAQVYGDQMQGGKGDSYAQFEGMWNDFNSMYTSIDKDQRLVAVVSAWVGCMSGAGYPGFAKVQDSIDQVNQRWGDLNGYSYQTAAGGGGAAAGSVEGATGTPTAPDPAEVTAFHEYEIKIALADFDCKATANYDTLYDDVRIELEKQFVTDHQDELNRYRDVMNSGGG